jgi:hypothetical protein
LASTALGIDFLLLLLKMITPSHEDKGVLTSRRRALLDVISGLGGEGTSAALVLDPVGEISRERAAKARASKDQTQSQPSSTSESDNISQGEALRSDRELSSEFMSVDVGIVADQLQERKSKLHTIQEGERAKHMAMAMVDPRTSERFSRAETQAERRMYRALSALAAMRSQSPSDLLPPAKPKLQAEPEQPQSESDT